MYSCKCKQPQFHSLGRVIARYSVNRSRWPGAWVNKWTTGHVVYLSVFLNVWCCTQVRGHSKSAAVSAISQTAAGRCCLVPAATLLLPTTVMAVLSKLKWLPNLCVVIVITVVLIGVCVDKLNAVPKNKKLALFLELGIIYLALQAALPAALAVFPQVLLCCGCCFCCCCCTCC